MTDDGRKLAGPAPGPGDGLEWATVCREGVSVSAPLPSPLLPLARYRLSFAALDPVRLPDYAGSAWRGVFGRSLKRLVCVTRAPACPDCLLYRSCVYPYLFETPPDPAVGKLRKYTAAPHPFVLAPGPTNAGPVPPGRSVDLDLTLFGHGNRYLAYAIHALEQAARQGLGRREGRLELARVAQWMGQGWAAILEPGGRLEPLPPAPPAPPPCPPRLTLHLETPLRLKLEGQNLTPEGFRFSVLFSNLLRRVSLLTAFHTDIPLETDFAGLSRAARAVEADRVELRWHDWTRYSSRQDTLLQMGGLLGRVTLTGAGLEPFWPYLWLGQWTHAGKGTSMGLGRYRIEAC